MPALTAPLRRGGQQRIGDTLIVDALEEAKEPYLVVVGLVMESVADGGNSPDYLVAPLGDEVLGFGVVEERVFRAGEHDAHVPTQRRDPERVPRVQPVGKVNEPAEVPVGSDRADRDRSAQMTPSSFPIRPIVSMQ